MTDLAAALGEIVARAFGDLGLPVELARTTASDRPDLADFQCNGALAAAKAARRNPREIAMGYVIRGIEGPLALLPCVSQTSYQRCEECVDERTCGLRLVMKDVRDATAKILDHTTLAGLNGKVRRASAASTFWVSRVSG